MMRNGSRAKWHAPAFTIFCVLAGAALAQEPAATQPDQSAATQPAAPAVAPQAYRIQPSNMLVYWVRINSRSSQNPNAMERIDRRELAVFDVNDEGQLVLYVGSPKDSRPAGSMQPAAQQPPMRREGRENREAREHRAAMPTPAPAEASPEKPERLEMTWTKYELGKSFDRNDDGTISFRPGSAVTAYPVLPLPPEDAKPKERFEVTVPDIAAGPDKTLQLAGSWKASGDKIAVEARLEPKIVPGVPFVPEMAIFTYELAREPAAVTQVHESRRLPGEPPAQPAEPATGDQPRPSGMRGPRAVGAAQRPVAPVINVMITLDKTRPLTADEHRAIVAMASGGAATGTEAIGQTRQALPEEVQDVLQQMGGWGEAARQQLEKVPGR